VTAFDDDYDIRTFAAALSPESTDDQPRADAETAAWIRAEALGFHEAAPDDAAVGRTARRLAADGRRETGVHPREPREGALDADGLPVATFESFVESLNVGGGRLIDAHLISGVTVQPTHRRRGILRRLMTDDLARAKSAGLAVAALTASEGSIYRRFGFGVGVRERTIEVDPRRASGLLGDPEGAVELVSRDALDGLAPGVFARFHARTPGSIDRHEGSWNRLLGRERPDGTPDPAVRGAVHRDSAGTLDGYVSYRLEGENEAHTLVVLDLVAATDDAYLGLWQLLLSVDLVARVRFAGASQSDPIGHALVNGRALRVTHDEDHVWFRILDTVAALQARPWAADGVVTIAVGDSLGHAAGTFRVTSEGGSATVKRAAVRRADIELDVATLGSLWLGGVDPVTLAAAGLVRERRKGAVQTVRAMIAPDRPVHSITHF
jgi:predicted acetyltransferase